MTYEAKPDNPVVHALITPVIRTENVYIDSAVFSEDSVEIKAHKQGRGLEVAFPCTGSQTPVLLKGVDRNGRSMVLRYEQNPDFGKYVLQFVGTSKEKGFHYTLNKMAKTLESYQKNKNAFSDFQFPSTMKGSLEYRTFLGEWNALPQELLKHILEFSFDSTGAEISWPYVISKTSLKQTDSSRVSVRWHDYGISQEEMQNRREAFIEALTSRGLIRKEIRESSKFYGREEKLLLEYSEVHTVMRELEDYVRRTGDNIEYGERVELGFSGDFSTGNILRIRPEIFDSKLRRGKLENELFRIKGGSLCRGNNCVEVEVFGGLEASAKLGSLLHKDYKIEADKFEIPQKREPLIRATRV